MRVKQFSLDRTMHWIEVRNGKRSGEDAETELECRT